MLAAVHDGHIRVYHTSDNNSAGLPFTVELIDEKVIVFRSIYEEIKPGDIIQSVNGIPAYEIIRDEMDLTSGSPQLRRYRALRRFGIGESNSKATVSVIREGEILSFEIPRSSQHSNNKALNKKELSPIARIEEDLFYVDLDRASMEQIRKKLKEIASAEGVIFDLRGYPNSNHQVISHLLTEPDTSDRWMKVPRIIYPDRENIVEYENYGWNMRPASPHIGGRVVFITDSRAISYAESFMSFIEHYGLGEIVGQPTAGTNGNINRVKLPGGYSFAWTGMKVVKHDGSQHHLVGIQPTIPVKKTIAGIREGRDEFLEKAIEIVRQ